MDEFRQPRIAILASLLAACALTACSSSAPSPGPRAGQADARDSHDASAYFASTESKSGGKATPAETAAVATLEARGAQLERDDAGRVVGIKAASEPLRNDDLTLLADLPGLKSLHLANSRSLTPESFARLTQIEELNLDGSDVRDDGLAVIGRLPALRRLRLPRTFVSDAGLAHLRDAKSLELLDLQECNLVSNAGLAHLVGLSKLRDLKVWGERIDDGGLESIATLGNLTSLGLDDTKTTDLAPLTRLKKLQRLSVVRSAIDDRGLAAAGALPELKQLRLRGTPITDAGLATLRGLEKLTNLDLSETRVGDAGLAHVASFANLEDLNLWKTNVGDAGLASLKALTKLRRLNLDDDGDVTDVGVAHLAGLQALEFLHLGDTQVSDRGLAELGGLAKLKDLNVEHCANVTPQGTADLKRRLPKLNVKE